MVILFDGRATKPIGFSRSEMMKYINKVKSSNDSLEDFILLSPEQKNIWITLPTKVATKLFLPETITLEMFAHYCSEEIDPDRREEEERYNSAASYVINAETTIAFPKGARLKYLQPRIHYTESYQPILFEETFVGAAYELTLENQFPRIVRTEKMFRENEKYNSFVKQIKDTLKQNQDIDLYGPAEQELTFIRTTPEIALKGSFIADYYAKQQY